MKNNILDKVKTNKLADYSLSIFRKVTVESALKYPPEIVKQEILKTKATCYTSIALGGSTLITGALCKHLKGIYIGASLISISLLGLKYCNYIKSETEKVWLSNAK